MNDGPALGREDREGTLPKPPQGRRRRGLGRDLQPRREIDSDGRHGPDGPTLGRGHGPARRRVVDATRGDFHRRVQPGRRRHPHGRRGRQGRVLADENGPAGGPAPQTPGRRPGGGLPGRRQGRVDRCDDGLVRLWDVSPEAEANFPLPDPQEVAGAAFSPDGEALVVGGASGTVRQWAASTGRPWPGEPLRLSGEIGAWPTAPTAAWS